MRVSLLPASCASAEGRGFYGQRPLRLCGVQVRGTAKRCAVKERAPDRVVELHCCGLRGECLGSRGCAETTAEVGGGGAPVDKAGGIQMGRHKKRQNAVQKRKSGCMYFWRVIASCSAIGIHFPPVAHFCGQAFKSFWGYSETLAALMGTVTPLLRHLEGR